MELETNVYFGYGLSFFANGTVNRAVYVGTGVPNNLFVQNSPDNTEGFGLTYQTRNLDFGFFHKRIGEQWNDNKAYHNQYLSAPFNLDNLFLNYTVRNDSILDRTHFSLAVNNLLDTRNIVQIGSFGNKAVALPGSTYLGDDGAERRRSADADAGSQHLADDHASATRRRTSKLNPTATQKAAANLAAAFVRVDRA